MPQLLEFERPPVIETVLSVQFQPLPEIVTTHLGSLWDSVRDRFPLFEIRPPVSTAVEQFQEGDAPAGTVVTSSAEALVRCWFTSTDKATLIQVQSDRFIHNWRRTKEAPEYPRYSTIRPRFEQEWGSFCAFLEKCGLGLPVPNQCEVTYVNHIELRHGEGDRLRLEEVSPMLAGASAKTFLPDPVWIECKTVYDMAERAGRLHVSLNPVIRRADGERIAVLQLTARGRPRGHKAADVLEWLDVGREWVVRGFFDATSQTMHKLWGYRGT